jgi:surface protein
MKLPSVRPLISTVARAAALSLILLLFNLGAAQASALSGNPDAFITTWDTNHFGNTDFGQIIIPGTGTGYLIEWEEVSNPANFGTAIGHGPTTVTFPGSGIYRVSISGDFTRIHFDNTGDCLKLLSIEQWGNIAWSSMEGAFWGCSNLTYAATDVPDLSRVASMASMFRECKAFNGPIGNWNTAAVTDMSGMFWGAESFDQPIGEWNTSAVTDMSHLFDYALSFNQPIGDWNTAAVTNMSRMFNFAGLFNQPIGDWNTAAVTDMSGMFNYVRFFNQPIGEWNTAAVTNMSMMFSRAYSFNQPIDRWNTAAVTDMSGMFDNAHAFNQPIGEWNTAAVTDIGWMFQNARSFNQPIGGWNTAAVTNMVGTFWGANSFNQPIGDWNTAQVTNMGFMFAGAHAFNQPIGEWNTSAVTGMHGMFWGAIAFNQHIGLWNTAAVTTMKSMFRMAHSFNRPIGGWNTSAVTDMSDMFMSAHSFNQRIGSWNTSAVKGMSRMFADARAFSQNLGNWDLSSLLDNGFFHGLSSMFHNAGMDCENYDATLIGWNRNPQTPDNMRLDARNVRYWRSQEARDSLIAVKGWIIIMDMFEECGYPVRDDPDEDVPATAFPNPNSGQFTLDLPWPAEVRLFNAQGALLWQQPCAPGWHELHISGGAGVYMLELRQDDKRKILRVVKR